MTGFLDYLDQPLRPLDQLRQDLEARRRELLAGERAGGDVELELTLRQLADLELFLA